MKQCKKCDKRFTPSKGLINFCSLQCRNSRIFSEETNNKKRIATSKFWSSLSDEGRVLLQAKMKTPERLEKFKETCRLKMLNADFSTLGFGTKRSRIIHEQNNSCNRCGISVWLDTPIILEIDHIDGNNDNNSRDNLEGLCPNCHSLTPTWRGRNKPSKNGCNMVSDDVLLENIMKTGNIRQGLLACGLAAKGGNYKRAKKLLGKSNAYGKRVIRKESIGA